MFLFFFGFCFFPGDEIQQSKTSLNNKSSKLNQMARRCPAWQVAMVSLSRPTTNRNHHSLEKTQNTFHDFYNMVVQTLPYFGRNNMI